MHDAKAAELTAKAAAASKVHSDLSESPPLSRLALGAALLRSRLRITPSSRPRVPLQCPPVDVDEAATPSSTP